VLDVVVGLISLLLVGAGLCYFLATIGAGLLENRRHRKHGARPSTEASTGAGGGDDGEPITVYFLVPCLNEEAVIGSTVAALLTHAGARVVVVDDASDDGTAEVMASFRGDNVMVVSRTLPQAREGKGPALNVGFRAVVADATARGLDPSRVLVCVMDADGELTPDAFDHVLPLFGDPLVGGVQLGVRIKNRRTNLLTRMQDFEFWGISATAQMGRIRPGTVSLGGNGQFTRLSALLALGGAPWSAALTEDLDLTITLMLAGWKLTSTPGASVNQQGIESVRKLIRQRTRWFQGHMSCLGRLGPLWKCSTLSNLALVEISVYLLIPWLFVLPWSILFHVAVWQMIENIGGLTVGTDDLAGRLTLGATLAFWYVMAFAPSIFAGYIYYRREGGYGRLRAAALGHMLVPYNYIAFASCWLATVRKLRGRTGWEKTARRREPGWEPALVVSELAVPGGAAVAMPVPGIVHTEGTVDRRLIVSGTVTLARPVASGGARPVFVTGRFRPSAHPAGERALPRPEPAPAPERVAV